MSKEFEKILVDRCYKDQADAMYISEMDINELYLNTHSGWEQTTPEKLKDLIDRKGPQDIVLRCTTHDMGAMKSSSEEELDRNFMDSGLQEFYGVDTFEYVGEEIIISSEDVFVSSLNLHDAWVERVDLERSKFHILSDEEQNWLDSKSWDGNADMSWNDDGRTF